MLLSDKLINQVQSPDEAVLCHFFPEARSHPKWKDLNAVD